MRSSSGLLASQFLRLDEAGQGIVDPRTVACAFAGDVADHPQLAASAEPVVAGRRISRS